MSIQLQIAIPLFVTFAALVGIAVWRKYLKPEVFVIGLTVLALGGYMTWLHTDSTAAADITDSQKVSSRDAVSLVLADEYMLQGQYDEAMEILQELSLSGDNGEVRLAMARCALLRQDYGAAVQLYTQSGQDAGQEPAEAAALLLSAQGGDGALVTYLTDKGYDAGEYGLSAGTSADADYSRAKDLVLEAVADHLKQCKETYGDSVVKAASHAGKVSRAFSAFVSDGEMDMEELESALSSLEKSIRSQPSLAENPFIRIARMKGYLITGNYKKIAACADENVSAQELMVLAELYVNGLVSESDFSKDHMDVSATATKNIIKLCRENLKRHKKDLSDADYEKYTRSLEEMEEQLKTPGLFTLRRGLLEQAGSGDVSMRSKSYLALAKIENFCGDAEKTSVYISAALGTAGDSDDGSYRASMNQLAGILQGTADSDEIQKVAQYVDQSLEHSLPLELEVSRLEQPEQEESENPEEQGSSFADAMTQQVNESTATLNIGFINKDSFPQVSARVQIQSAKWQTLEEIRANLQVYDCGSAITEFTLEPVEFRTSRIILLCDISGSMDGSEDELKEAIIAFADKMQEGEEVCVIGFASDIVFIHEFSGDKETVKSYAGSIRTGGGTALYDALLEAGKLIPYDTEANNVIIAMTDGQDGSPATEGEMRSYIGALSADKNVTVYTVGLGGSVDVDYLTMMAKYGNGSALFAQSKEELNDFYDFIHGQLRHQYILRYTAKNTTKNQRVLELSLTGEAGKAQRTYYLVEPEYTDEDTSSFNPYVVEDAEVTVYGFTTKFLYKSSQPQTLILRGQGFDAGDDITVRLTGNVEYQLTATFRDSTTYEVTLPPEVCVGVYDVSVSVGGSGGVLSKELTVAVQGDEKSFHYGAYVFTALDAYRNDQGAMVLSGNVVMNGWLRFKGDVVIQGEATDERIRVTDNAGFYIGYSAATAQGLAKTMADLGFNLSLGALGTFQLYGDGYSPGSYKDFRVEEIDVLWELNLWFLSVENMRIAIYPDTLMLQVPQMEFQLPLQNQLLRDLSMSKNSKLETEADILLTATRIALTGEVKYSTEKAKNAEEFVMVSLPLRLESLKVTVDTLKNEYKLEAQVKLKALSSMEDTFKLSFGIKDGKFDSLGFQTDAASVTIVPQPVPISMGDFGFELSGFSKYTDDNSALENILSTKITFKFKVDAAKLEDYLPGIEELLDKEDIALATLDDCELSLELKEFRIAFEAKLKLCSYLEVGKCKVTMGKFDYTNALIGYYNETEYGLQVAVTLGSTWKSKNISLQLTGTAELTLGYPYSGLWLDGDVDFDVGWWLLRADVAVSGDAMIGIYKNSAGNLQFSVIVRGTGTSGRSDGFHVYFTKATGLGMYSY